MDLLVLEAESNVWPTTVLFSPIWPKETKRLDTPGIEKKLGTGDMPFRFYLSLGPSLTTSGSWLP